jgi:hypothetical protein
MISKSSPETADFQGGKIVELAGVPCASLWITVKNEGRTSIKHLRAKAQVIVTEWCGGPVKPDADLETHFMGMSFPFLKRGTMSVPWTELHLTLAHDVDLGPLNDIIGTSLIRVLSFNEPELKQRIEKAFPPFPPELKEEYPDTKVVIALIGQNPFLMFTVGDTPEPLLGFLIRFWIIGENLDRDYQRIFRIEIPLDLKSVICYPINKKNKGYKRVVGQFS